MSLAVGSVLAERAVQPTALVPEMTTEPAAHAEQLAGAYREHREDLLRFARSRLGDRALAEEAVQETFLRAWRSIGRFDPDSGSMRMWLFGICRNAVNDAVRRRSNDARTQQTVGEIDVVTDGELEQVLARWQAEDVLRRMSPSQRHAVIQVHLHERPYASVAAELGVAVGTVKSRVHIGLESARDQSRRAQTRMRLNG